tara:strand:+ start:1785 stop:2915 length:1131 start_codon:yes stop_codon:yes gene_type:complete
MDLQKLEQLSNSSGIPIDLLSRSIQARAEAAGVSSDDILNNWSGGEPIVATNEKVSDTTKVEDVNIEPQQDASEVPIEEELVKEDTDSNNVAEDITGSTTIVLEEAPPPVPLSQKIFKSLKYGLSYGLIAGFIQGLVTSSYLYDGLILEAETQNLISEYNTVSFVLILSLTTAFLGALNSLNIKKLLERNFLGFGVLTNDKESIYTGVGLGLVFGSSSAFFIVNSVGQTIVGILPEDPVVNLISVGSAFWRIVLMSAIIQSLISILTMILGIPKGLDLDDLIEANKIRNRIVGSIIIPLGSIVVGGIIAVSIAQIFLNFHEYAPLFALIISAAILLFASVMSSAPKIRITRSEVIIASVGVITLIVIIASVAASQS